MGGQCWAWTQRGLPQDGAALRAGDARQRGGQRDPEPALKELLLKLRQLAYNADDVLDELEYFRIQDALDGTYHAADAHDGGCAHGLLLHARHSARAVAGKLKLSSGSCNASRAKSDEPRTGWLSFCGACASKMQQKKHVVQAPKLKFDRVKISKKMKDIVEKLKPVSAKVSTILDMELGSAILRLQMLSSNSATVQRNGTDRPKTTPDIIEPKLYGRDDQKRCIIDGITDGDYFADELVVLPIVGPGGIGKTTFTQHLYKEVKSHYEVSIWICVSLKFNANRLAQEAVTKIPKVDGETENSSDQELIEQRLKGKRFLLVLDDLWTCNEDEWKKLLAPFRKGREKGNIIIVTTRIPEVAKLVMTVDCPIEMQRLAQKDFMDLFEACVFGQQHSWKDHPKLLDAGEKIVSKLKGIPLAAKTVGRLLRKQLSLDHWTRVLESKEWELQTNDNDIMPALKLSYDYLPFHLQQCFSYCALFAEDYEFRSDELIHLWIGIGILRLPDHNKRPEDVGVRSIKIPPSVRHLSIMIDDRDVENRMNFENLKKELRALDKRINVESLHTLMLFGSHHGSFARIFGHLFREATGLRTIYLSGASYTVEDMLPNFSKLVHLRYIKIMSSYICLPAAFTRLYHLEVIDLQKWAGSFILTRYMNNLVKLRHFLVPDYQIQLHSDIFEVGKLKSLQELRRFEVGNERTGFELSELGQLTQLGGSLAICNLGKIRAAEEACEAELINKNRLHNLTLEWNADQDNKDPTQEENTLETLVPHSNLLKLCIRGHHGATCPSWLSVNLSVKNLESLHLDGVAWKTFPPIGELWLINENGKGVTSKLSDKKFDKLRRLELVKLLGLKKWVGDAPCQLFPHLEVLIIKDCSELVEMSFSHSTCCQKEKDADKSWFPKLLETKAPCSADIRGVGSACKQLSFRKSYESKYSLEIEANDASDSMFWNVLSLQNLIELKEFKMDNCPPLQPDHFQMLLYLKTLWVCNSSSAFLLVEDGSQVEYQFPVEHMRITNCGASGKELTHILTSFPKLLTLCTWNCEKITGLVVSKQQETTPPAASSSANNGDVAQVKLHQQQDARGRKEIVASAEDGLLL
ncbi:hypothetical protein ACP4OV_025655 [Aristida adscensionis]